jgi:hypothetical protein
MHYYALAIVPAEGDLNELLDETLAPYSEHREDVDIDKIPLSWDWYQVGGRFSGRLGDYDPQHDPRNWEDCDLCKETPGLRNDRLGKEHREANPDYGCNGCDQYRKITGKPGVRVKWPTEWAGNPGDVQDGLAVTARLAELPDSALPFAIITHGSESVTVRKRWTGEDFVETGADFRATLGTILSARTQAGIRDRVVVIDYHC